VVGTPYSRALVFRSTPLSSRFRVAAAVLAGALLAGACTGPPGAPDGAPTLDEMASDLGTDVVRDLWRGYVHGRSGEIALVPTPWSVVAQWPGGLRSPRDPRTTHAGPWDYLARVPIMLYGPGFIREGVRADRSVDVTDIPATFAELMNFGFSTPDSEVLHEAVLPAGERNGVPAVIVLLAHDGGGWNFLEQWPDAWPEQLRLAMEGTTYTNATVGSAPPVTAPVHANMGTGRYPRDGHLMAENTGRLPDGSLGEYFFWEADPRLIEVDSLADEWSRARDHEPWVGLLAYEGWHLGMLGKGARAEGGARHAAVLWDREEHEFWTNEEVYSLPDYLPGREVLDRHIHELDVRDGAADRRWRGVDLDDEFYLGGLPAFVTYQGEALLEMVEREPIGETGHTDLLFVELKPTDTAGHLWNMLSPHTRDVMREQDRVLGELVAALDEKVGRDRWVIAVTADHGQAPRPDAVDGFRIDRFVLEGMLKEAFGEEVVETVQPDDVYVDMEAVRERGISLEDMARFIADVRFEQVAPEGVDLGALPRVVREARVFAAVLPGEYLDALTEADIEALGPGIYREGDLTSPPDYGPLLGG
jgi:hypothetical protein